MTKPFLGASLILKTICSRNSVYLIILTVNQMKTSRTSSWALIISRSSAKTFNFWNMDNNCIGKMVNKMDRSQTSWWNRQWSKHMIAKKKVLMLRSTLRNSLTSCVWWRVEKKFRLRTLSISCSCLFRTLLRDSKIQLKPLNDVK